MKNTTNYTSKMGLNTFKAILRAKNIESSASGTKCAILYGDKLANAVHMRVDLYNNSVKSAFKAFQRTSGVMKASATDIDLSDGTHTITTAGRGDRAILEDVVASDVVNVLFLREDLIKLSDSRYFITYEIAKQRKIHECNECHEYYREACACLSIAEIRSYSYKPALSFTDIGADNQATQSTRSPNTASITDGVDKRAFIGVEWELTKTNNKSRQHNATSLFKFLKKNKTTKHFLELFQAVKDDVSVSEGFELVSHPFSAPYYEANQESFEAMAEHAQKMKLRGVGNGIHVHISKSAFTTATLAKWLKLFHNNSNVLLELSGRNLHADLGHGFNRWAKLDMPSAYKTTKSKLGKDYGVNTYSSDFAFHSMASDALAGDISNNRYNFMNFNNRGTIEYRLPASTTDVKEADYSNFCRHIELVFASWEYVQEAIITEVTFASFLEFLEASEKHVNLYNAIITNKSALRLILGSNENLAKAGALELVTLDEMDLSNRESLEDAQRALTEYLSTSAPQSFEDVEDKVELKFNKTKKRGI